MPRAAKVISYVSGVIDQKSANGIKVKGEWYNYSQFADGSVDPDHQKGDHVALDVSEDKNGVPKWIESLSVQDDDPRRPPSRPAPRPASPATGAPPAAKASPMDDLEKAQSSATLVESMHQLLKAQDEYLKSLAHLNARAAALIAASTLCSLDGVEVDNAELTDRAATLLTWIEKK